MRAAGVSGDGTSVMTTATLATTPTSGVKRDAELTRILGLSVPVAATLAETEMTVESILAVTVGSILEFDVPVDAELTLYVGNRPIGRGQAVKTGENFGVRVTRIDTLAHRIGAMRGD